MQASIKDNSENNTTDKIKAMLISTDGDVSAAESTNKAILGFLASDVGVMKSGEKYVAYASVAYGGNEGTVLYSAAKSSASDAIAEFGGYGKGDVIEFDIDASGKLTDGGAPSTKYVAGYLEYFESNVASIFGDGDYLLDSDTHIYRFDDDNEVTLTDSSALTSYTTDAGVYKAQRVYFNWKLDDSTQKIKTIFVAETREEMAGLSYSTSSSFRINDSDGNYATIRYNGSSFAVDSYSDTALKTGSTSLTVSNISNISGMSGTATAVVSGTIPAYGSAGTVSLTVTLSSLGSTDKTFTVPVAFADKNAVKLEDGDVITLTDTQNSHTATFSYSGGSFTLTNTSLAEGDTLDANSAVLTTGTLNGATISCSALTLAQGSNTLSVTFTKTGYKLL